MEGAGHTEGYAVVAGWCMSVDVCMCVYELASSFNQQHPYTTVTGSKQCVWLAVEASMVPWSHSPTISQGEGGATGCVIGAHSDRWEGGLAALKALTDTG